jgi:hypothetical protein
MSVQLDILMDIRETVKELQDSINRIEKMLGKGRPERDDLLRLREELAERGSWVLVETLAPLVPLKQSTIVALLVGDPSVVVTKNKSLQYIARLRYE